MEFADIHLHALYGADDGAKTEEEMQAIVDAAYADGTRVLCLTPHFHPGYFGDNVENVNTAFEKLTAYVRERHPQMQLFLGNELRYDRNCVAWLAEGLCRTLNHTRFVLVDFRSSEDCTELIHGLEKLLNAGYIPILAHAERYRNLTIKSLRSLRDNGVVVQMDAQSVFRGYGLGAQLSCKKMLAEQAVDIVASDAHDLKARPPVLSNCYEYIAGRHGRDYATAICRDNALRILNNNTTGKDLD